MTYKVKLEPRAAAEIEAARNWWLDTRAAAPNAFDEELDRAFEMIKSIPHAGQPLNDPGESEQRRIFLPRVCYHLYYRVRDNAVEVRAFWHASRGTGPDL